MAEVLLAYVRLHRATLPHQPSNDDAAQTKSNAAKTPTLSRLAAQIWMGSYQSSQQRQQQQQQSHNSNYNNSDNALLRQAATEDSDDVDDDRLLVRLQDYLGTPPEPFHEWTLPEQYRLIRDPTTVSLAPRGPRTTVMFTNAHDEEEKYPWNDYFRGGANISVAHESSGGGGGGGVEAVETLSDDWSQQGDANTVDPEFLLPKVILPGKEYDWNGGPLPDVVDDESSFCYIPVLAVRRHSCVGSATTTSWRGGTVP
jgi:hypothetical protein